MRLFDFAQLTHDMNVPHLHCLLIPISANLLDDHHIHCTEIVAAAELRLRTRTL